MENVAIETRLDSIGFKVMIDVLDILSQEKIRLVICSQLFIFRQLKTFLYNTYEIDILIGHQQLFRFFGILMMFSSTIYIQLEI